MATNIKLKRSATQGAVPGTSDIDLGEIALNTYDGKMYMKKTVSGSSSIVELTGSSAPTSSAFAHNTYKYTASGSQTTFTGSDADSKTLSYTAGQIQVFLNGVLLDAADYTASNGSSVVLGSAASANDILYIIAFQGTNPFDYWKYTATNAQTSFSGNDANSESLIYTTGNLAVYLNGVLLDATDYTATSGTTVVLASGASSGDILVIYEFNETGLTDVASDTTPQLGGNLDVNGSDIVSVSNGDIDIKPHGSGNIVLDGHTWPNSDGSSGQFLKTNGSGTLSFDTVSSAADDLTTGDSAVSLATSAGNITIDAQGNDTDIIFKGTDNSSDITMLTLDGSAAGKATFNNEITSGAVITSGAGLVIADAGNIGSASDTDALAISSGGVVTFTQQPVINSGVAIDNITIDGTEIDLSSGDLTLDVAGDIILDADGGDVKVSDGGTHIGTFTNSSSDFVITSAVQDKDIILKGDDGGSAITALTVDMSAAGKATFNNEVVSGSHISVGGSNNELRFYEGSNYVGFEAPALSADQIWVLPTADGSANQVIKTDGSGNLSFADAAATVSGLTDTTISSIASGDHLIYNGSAWVNQAQASNSVIATMTGDASDTTLALSRSPLSENAVHVYWDGVYQHKDTWSLSGSTVTFSTAPPTGVKVEAVVGSQTNILYGHDVTIDTMTGDASDTTLSLSVTPSNENHVNVYFDGVYQSKSNFSLSGSTITFATAPPTGVAVEAVSNQSVSIGTATGIAASALTGLSEVTAADADHVLIYDASGSALKKALVSDIIQTGEEIADTVGAMVSSNTETGITVTYQDADNTIDFALAAAQTSITSLLATDIKIGEDDQTKIDFETADEIHFYAANAHQVKLIDGAIVPVTDNDIDLGTSSLEFKDAFFDGTVTSDAFAGPLTGDVTGNADTATVATTVTITDNESTNENNAVIFTAGGDVDGGNLGLESDGNLTYNPSSGTLTATAFAGNITGTVTGTATGLAGTPNIAVGTLSTTGALTLGDYIEKTSGNLTIDVAGDIHLDADGGDVTFKDGGTQIGSLSNDSSNFVITSAVQNKDIVFKGDDAGTAVTSLTLDMSNVGRVVAANSSMVTQAALTSSSNAVAWDARTAQNAYHLTTENTTIGQPSGTAEGAVIMIEIAQGGTARTIAWNSVFEFASSTAPTMTATANKTDIYTFRYNGSKWQEIGRVQNMAQS